MQLIFNKSLKPYNTFGFDVNARSFAIAITEQDILDAVDASHKLNLPLKVLGGGSNLLIRKNQEGLILKMEIGGIASFEMPSGDVLVRAGGGCDWEMLIDYAAYNNLWGIENLTMIPGKVGSSPIQNIGAYGVELKDVFYSLRAFDLQTGCFININADDCRFGYRDSLFKHEGKGRYIITEVTLRLSKTPSLSKHYDQVTHALKDKGIFCPQPIDIVKIIREIRRSKLPDILEVGSAGSFFKNPILQGSCAKSFIMANPQAPVYVINDAMSKIAAGWLIEQCGWKGFKRGDAGVWPLQALVLVNYGKATGDEIAKLADEIIVSVKDKFGIRLEPEVNYW